VASDRSKAARTLSQAGLAWTGLLGMSEIDRRREQRNGQNLKVALPSRWLLHRPLQYA